MGPAITGPVACQGQIASSGAQPRQTDDARPCTPACTSQLDTTRATIQHTRAVGNPGTRLHLPSRTPARPLTAATPSWLLRAVSSISNALPSWEPTPIDSQSQTPTVSRHTGLFTKDRFLLSEPGFATSIRVALPNSIVFLLKKVSAPRAEEKDTYFKSIAFANVGELATLVRIASSTPRSHSCSTFWAVLTTAHKTWRPATGESDCFFGPGTRFSLPLTSRNTANHRGPSSGH